MSSAILLIGVFLRPYPPNLLWLSRSLLLLLWVILMEMLSIEDVLQFLLEGHLWQLQRIHSLNSLFLQCLIERLGKSVGKTFC